MVPVPVLVKAPDPEITPLRVSVLCNEPVVNVAALPRITLPLPLSEPIVLEKVWMLNVAPDATDTVELPLNALVDPANSVPPEMVVVPV